MPHYTAIILAAGASSRLGTSKQLLKIGPDPLLRHGAKLALSSQAAETVVVLGAAAEEHLAVIKDLPVHPVIHPEWARGMGSSVKAGVHAVGQLFPDTDGVCIMVCDQPHLSTTHLNRLMETGVTENMPVVASSYQDVAGVPALFHNTLFEALSALPDQQGARMLIQQFKDALSTIPFPEGAIDLDTPDDVKNWRG